MGGCASSQVQEYIRVGSLNYSGILNSPFEFYSEQFESQQKNLSDIFLEKLEKTIDGSLSSFKWNVGNIDKFLQKERYTPIYQKGAGVQNGRLMTLEEFGKKWQKQFKKFSPKYQSLNYTQKQKQNMKKFDTLCYESLVQYIYKVSYQQAIEMSTTLYQNFLVKFFQKSFLNQSKKIQKVIDVLNKNILDIILLQQTSFQLLEVVKHKTNYFVKEVHLGSSAILVNYNIIEGTDQTKDMLQKLPIELRQSLNWNLDTAVLFIDNFIIISGHLTSKKQKNLAQVQKMNKDIISLKQYFPSHIIIIGLDANNPALKSPDSSLFNIYPGEKERFTTFKKRTSLQVQSNKSNIESKQKKDYIISNANIVHGRISTISNMPVLPDQIPLIPSEQHPFDHFLITIKLPKSILLKNENEYN